MPHRTPLRNLFPPIPTFSAKAGDAALLVLDLQPFTTDRSTGIGRVASERGVETELDEYYEQVGYALPNAVELVAGARQVGLPVVLTRLASLVPGGGDPGASSFGVPLPAPDSPEAKVLPSLLAGAGATNDIVLVKNTLSPFASTPLDAILGSLGVRYLLVAGVMAGWAVELTAREAVDRGYGVLVVSDACPGETYAIHAFVMPQLLGGAIRVRPTAAVLEMLAGTRT